MNFRCLEAASRHLLDLGLMACFILVIDALVRNVWSCVVRHVIHDTEEAGRQLVPGNHSV